MKKTGHELGFRVEVWSSENAESKAESRKLSARAVIVSACFEPEKRRSGTIWN